MANVITRVNEYGENEIVRDGFNHDDKRELIRASVRICELVRYFEEYDGVVTFDTEESTCVYTKDRLKQLAIDLCRVACGSPTTFESAEI